MVSSWCLPFFPISKCRCTVCKCYIHLYHSVGSSQDPAFYSYKLQDGGPDPLGWISRGISSIYLQYHQPSTSSKQTADFSLLFEQRHIEFKETQIRWCFALRLIRLIDTEVMADFWQANELADAAAKSWYALPMVHQLEARAGVEGSSRNSPISILWSQGGVYILKKLNHGFIWCLV